MIDSTFITYLKQELGEKLTGGRIEKIRQPAKDIVLLTVKTRTGKYTLLLSASPSKARMHITELEYENPAEPPMFCMLLRKHITGAEIMEIAQPGEDRILSLVLRNADELGRSINETLYIEMVPGKTNIILVGADDLIVDCVYRRDYDADMYRRVFPGMIYRLPRLPEGFARREVTGSFSSDEFDTLSAFMDSYYSSQEKEEVYRRKSKELRTSLNSADKRIRKKLAAQKTELMRTDSREDIRRRADLITANIYRIRKGEKSIVCSDFYQEDAPDITIELDPLLSPQQNSAKLYKEYNKLKTAKEYLTVLINKGEDQLEYIGSALDELDRAASERDIADIKAELISAGIIKDRAKKQKNGKGAKKEKPQPPLVFISDDQYEIYAGRNNTQNDELTFETARRTDIWLHVKNIHGSHVIIRCDNTTPPETTLMQAAAVAVRVSQGKNSDNVAVDYTQVRYVKKPSGALPGKVIYTDYSTVIVKDAGRLMPQEKKTKK